MAPSIFLKRVDKVVTTLVTSRESSIRAPKQTGAGTSPVAETSKTPDLSCVPFCQASPSLFWSSPLGKTVSAIYNPSYTKPFPLTLAKKKVPSRNLINSRPLLKTLNSKLLFLSWCVALRYTCDARWLQPDEKRQTVCQWASLAVLLGNVGVFGSVSSLFSFFFLESLFTVLKHFFLTIWWYFSFALFLFW